MTKQYLHGRTEAIRPVTNESLDFVRKFCEDAPAKSKIDALKAACEKHTGITRQCSKGLGQDRHLYALYCLWQRGVMEDMPSNGSSVETDEYNGYASGPDYEGSEGSENGSSDIQRSKIRAAPAIFSDGAWDKLNTTIMSTSNCGNPCLRMFGFGPTSADGFGIGYIIKEDSISVCVSSKHRQTKRFVATLTNYLNDIRHLLRQTQKKAAPGTQSRARENEVEAPAAKKTTHGKQIATKVTSGTSSPSDDDDGGMLGGCKSFVLYLVRATKSNRVHRWFLRCW